MISHTTAWRWYQKVAHEHDGKDTLILHCLLVSLFLKKTYTHEDFLNFPLSLAAKEQPE